MPQYISVTKGWTDRRKDGRTTCGGNTEVLHRAV